eukprot:scaffold323_cov414-Prasinococcus_capsulatus_cf.AAC.22
MGNYRAQRGREASHRQGSQNPRYLPYLRVRRDRLDPLGSVTFIGQHTGMLATTARRGRVRGPTM